jgi:mycothiol synthase
MAGGLELVAPQLGDAARIAALLCRCADETGQGLVDEREIRIWLTNPDHDVANDIRLALRDGEPVGYVDLASSEGGARIAIDGRVPPDVSDAEAIAHALLAFAEERGASHAAGRLAAGQDAVMRAYSIGGAPWVACVEREGYRPVRTSYEMQIDLVATPPQAPRWPDGVAVRPLAGGEERALYEVHSEVFADVWDFTRRPFESWWHDAVVDPTFDRSLWLVALDGGEIAGYALCWDEASGRPQLGWVGSLGVRRPWRRRGLALALLRQAFAVLRERGRAQVGLGVDGDSTTGAVELYERAGMHVHARSTTYERPLGTEVSGRFDTTGRGV